MELVDGTESHLGYCFGICNLQGRETYKLVCRKIGYNLFVNLSARS